LKKEVKIDFWLWTRVYQIKENAYYDGNADAAITWVEFTDVNCFYCQKMAKDGTAETIMAKYPESVNHSIFSFIGTGGAATQTASEVLECIGMVA
jgi:protein-disulfide isomerase